MGFGSIGGFNPNLNAYGAGKVKKPAEGEQQGETKAPELKMAETKGAETDLNVNNLSGLDALAAQGRANLGKSLQVTGEINGTDAPVITQDAKTKDYSGYSNDDLAREIRHLREWISFLKAKPNLERREETALKEYEQNLRDATNEVKNRFGIE